MKEDKKWIESLKKDLTEEEIVKKATEEFHKQTNDFFITRSLEGYIEFYKACRILAKKQLKKNKNEI